MNEGSSEHGPSKRSIRNIRLTAPRYWNLMGSVFVVVVLFLIALCATLMMVISYQHELLKGLGVESAESLLDTQRLFVRVFWFQVACFLVAVIGLFTRTGHRISGTYVAMKRTFNAIRTGDRHARLRFRKYDQLDDVSEAFNDMMDSLVSSDPSQTSDPDPE